MAYFKDNNNTLHFLDDVSFTYLLSADCVPITDEEAEAIRQAVTDAQPKTYTPLSAWQIRKVLTQSGLRKQVEDAVLVADSDTQDAWHYASNFQRDDAILNAMATKLGITATQLDDLFTLASTL